MNQNRAILQFMQKNEISQLIATYEIGALRLSERIREIEFMGFRIDRRKAEMPNRFGNMARYTVYSLPRCRENLALLKKIMGEKKTTKKCK